MKLNLGSGDLRREGDSWVNVDLRADVADVVCDVASLTFVEDGTVDEIVAHDLLEHFPASRTADVLAEWRRVLIPGGRLSVKVPNMLRLCEMIAAGLHVELAIRNVYGGHRWGPDGAWDTHHHGFTPDLLEAELTKAGFDVDWNDLEVNMTAVAHKADR